MAVTKVQLSNNNTDYTKQINDNFSELDTNKVSTEAGKGLSTNDYTNAEKTKLEGVEAGAQVNTVNSVNTKTGVIVLNLDDISDGTTRKLLTKDVNDLTNYELKTNTGSTLTASVDSSTFVMTIQLKNSAGTVLSTGTVDLPLETMVVNASYADGVLTLTLQNGQTVDVDISDIVSGLVPDSRTIAGLDLADNITKAEMLTALNVEDGANNYVLPNDVVQDADYVHTDNNYTTTEKTKLAGIEAGAQVNKIESVKVNGTAQTITNKGVDISVPTEIFKTVKVGTTNIVASSTTDTVELEAGTNISLSADATTKKITINATVPAGGTTISTLTFTSAQSGWGTIDANGNYTLTIANTGTPINVLKQSTDGGYEACMANIRADGTNFYVTADAKFDGMIMCY